MKLQTNATVYSSRERVNVILPGTGYRGEGNHFYPPARGNVRNYVADMTLDAVLSEQENGSYPRHVRFTIGSVRPDPMERGKYTVSVYRCAHCRDLAETE